MRGLHPRHRGFSMLGTVIAFAAVAVLVVVAATATWRLAAPGLGEPGGVRTDTRPGGDEPGAAAASPGRVLSAARGVVLTSHAQALASELAAVATTGQIEEADVTAAAARFPVEVDGVTITADTSTFRVDRTIRLSDGSATACVVAPADGRPHAGPC